MFCLYKGMDALQIKRTNTLAWRVNLVINEMVKVRFFYLSMKEDLL